MATVKLLDTNTINKIAAGEVVERPASVVKELVENSIDAGAKRIEIEIQNGGKALIRVTDDGAGMTLEDAALAVRRHATSKLSNAADLQSISTLGFRGEALPTISAVSKFTLQTRRADDELGTKIKIDGGKTQDTHEVGCKVGTTVLVEEIFFNTPARLKFLKTTPTEANKIHEFVIKLALSRPDIAFRFINGNRVALATPGNGKVIDALSAIYGTELTDSLLTLKNDIADLKLRGYVTKPNILKSYRSWQTFIVNGRVVENRTISKAVDEAYKSLVPKSGFPLAVLIIDVPQTSIDVNVHPQKIELKFEDEGKIFKAVYHAVREAVAGRDDAISHDLTEVAAAPETPRFEQLNLIDEISEPPPEKISEPVKKSSPPEKISEPVKKSSPPEKISEPVKKSSPPEKISEPVKKSSPPEKFSEPVKKSSPPEKTFELEPIGQVARCYIVAQGGADLYIVDQHAAHERILFDKLNDYAEKIPTQGLLIHRVVKFDSREAELIEKNLSVFAELGFTLEPSGANEFRVTEVPLDAADADAENLLRGIIEEIFSGVNEAGDLAKKIRQATLATTACKAAIKAGQELNLRQMQILLSDLARTAHPHTCPHGRPTIIKFSAGDLSKMFKRT
ncbi:MAG: DNA mismatch repair endonuclease MutL [Selenomonadaceae bacterium]|nr:DNA mismatch repair endonuclease MutL [Selenomonadaceae bacterium]